MIAAPAIWSEPRMASGHHASAGRQRIRVGFDYETPPDQTILNVPSQCLRTTDLQIYHAGDFKLFAHFEMMALIESVIISSLQLLV